MQIPFLDLSVTDPSLKSSYLQAIERVLSHGRLIMGPEVKELEERLATFCKSSFALLVSSGTDALYLGLRVLGIGQGDEVIIPCMTFVATANAVRMTGATPVLADIDDDFTICVDSVQRVITSRTKAILPVHYAGKIANMEAISHIAAANGLKVVEDASQAFGAVQDQRPAGSFGDIGCISLNPMKVLGALGEAGVLLTQDRACLAALETLRYNGLVDRHTCVEVSSNFKPDTIHAAVLLERLKDVGRLIEKRRAIASLYRERLGHIAGLKLPLDHPGCQDVYYTFTLLADSRDELMKHLRSRGIETKIYHRLVSSEPAYSGITGEWTNGERIVAHKLALPCNAKLTDRQLDLVVESIVEFYHGN